MEQNKREILRMLGEGMTLSAICRELKISRPTYYNYRKSDPDFAAQCDLILASNTASKEEKQQKRQTPSEFSGDGIESPDPFTPYSGKRPQAILKEKAELLRSALREAGNYSLSLEPQISSAAQQWALIEILWGSIGIYAVMQSDISREGNARLAVNPLPEQIRKNIESFNHSLRALGLNAEAKIEKQEVSSRERFFDQLRDDDD